MGPVVATVGVGVGATEVTGVLDGEALVGSVEVGLDVAPPEPLLVHATAPARIRASGAIPHFRTL